MKKKRLVSIAFLLVLTWALWGSNYPYWGFLLALSVMYVTAG